MKKILAITACPAGVAHTYMVAQKLEDAIKAKGYEAKVETQGAVGIENRITKEDIDDAIGVIFANEVAIIDSERFDDFPILECSLQEALKDSESLVEELIEAVK